MARDGGTAIDHANSAEVLSELPIGLALISADDRLVFANPHFSEVFDADPALIAPGRSVDDLIRLMADDDIFDDASQIAAMRDKVQNLKPGEILESTIQLQSGQRIGQKIKKLSNGSWLAVLTDLTAVMEAEAQAREAENRWSFALESARQGVWDSDLRTGTVFYSHMWRVIRGLEQVDEHELTPEAWRGRLHPEDSERVLDTIARQDNGETFANGIEYRERHRDGHWIWILCRGQAVAWDANGKPTRIIGTDSDITEMRNAQAALSEAEGRWNFALQGTGQGVWDADLREGTVFYSPTWRDMRGFGHDEDIDSSADTWLERVHPGDRDRIRDTIGKLDRGALLHNSFEYRERHRDGHYLWIQSRGEPVAWDASGRPTRMIGIDIDITVRKELELRVRESLQLVNTMLDNFPGGICMIDKHLVMRAANSIYYEINDLDEHWFPVGSKFEDILRHHAVRGDFGPVDVEAFVAERIQLSHYSQPRRFSLPRPTTGAMIEYTITPLAEGGFVMTFQDISERIKAEEEKSQLEKELIQAQRLESLGTLASGIAHEINTPIQYVGDNIRFIAQSLRDMLAVLQGYRKSMRRPIDPGLIAEQAEALAELEKSLDLGFILEELPLALEQSAQGVKQVATIVKAIKEFSHPGQDEKTEFDINALIETTLIVSRNQWKYVAEVETDLDPSLPPFRCLPGELGQALLNLVVNAAHAIESAGRENGLIRVTTRHVGRRAVITISDNGCGMSEAIRARIYDPFFTTKDIGKGTGQGLTIAFNAVVKKHGGTIDCDSAEGAGTTFTMALPMDKETEIGSEIAA
ncbi:MAG: PAS-domain containing protein [Alphaproteobacteria bacterium]|nr:PAS-domain containing protein [Alphaproteobacteria bacterium]